MAVLAALPEGAYVGAAHVARKIKAPQNYLSKLLQTLSRQGLVVSQKGLHGGFRLAYAPEEMTLLEVLDPIDRVSDWNGCFLGKQRCSSRNPCAVHRKWEKVRDQYFDFLSNTTIAEIAAAKTRN